MAGTSGAYVGRDVVVYISYNQDQSAIPNDFTRIRNKEFGAEWEDVDATADDSPDFTRENLVTFKSFPVTLDGVSRQEESKGLDTLEDYVINPPNGQPCGWLKIVRPSKNSQNKTYYVPMIFTSFKTTSAYDDVVKWNMDSKSNGAVSIEYTA
jgi:hypothetical protein